MKKDSSRDFPKCARHNLPILGIQLTNPGWNDNGRVLFNGFESEASYVATEIRGKYAAMTPNVPNNITVISHQAILLECFRIKFLSGPTRFILAFYFFYSCSTISRYVTLDFFRPTIIYRFSLFEKEVVITNNSTLFLSQEHHDVPARFRGISSRDSTLESASPLCNNEEQRGDKYSQLTAFTPCRLPGCC